MLAGSVNCSCFAGAHAEGVPNLVGADLKVRRFTPFLTAQKDVIQWRELKVVRIWWPRVGTCASFQARMLRMVGFQVRGFAEVKTM